MTREEKIAILMKDRCTKKEAERFLMEGTSIFESKEFEQHFDLYMKNWIKRLKK